MSTPVASASATPDANSPAARLQAATAAYQALQTELSNAVEARQRRETQLTETGMVKEEFSKLKPDSEIYKLIGPVLVKQDQAEARVNVGKRLDFIRGEIQRIETQIKDIGERSEKRRTEILEIQAQAARQQQSAAGTPLAVS